MAKQRNAKCAVIADSCFEYRTYLETILQVNGCNVRIAEDSAELLTILHDDPGIGLVFVDAGMSGARSLGELCAESPELQVFLITDRQLSRSIHAVTPNVELLEKPFQPEDVLSLLNRDAQPAAIPAETEVAEVNRAEHVWPPQTQFMERIDDLIRQVGSEDVPVLIQGETGSGKEVLARQIHECSDRASYAFVKVNCAALPSELVESELFGYERGAFSGAVQQHKGLFEAAHQGTILLDEIGDMDVRLQAKLLQVLQDGEFRRVGGRELIRVDVRVIAATHQNLAIAIREGRFREDLFYRLNVVCIQVPPLRERRAEISSLAEHLLRRHCKRGITPPEIPPLLEDAMVRHDWPGNVRELENAMRKYLIMRNPLVLADELLALRTRSLSRADPNAEGHQGGYAQLPQAGEDTSLLERVERMKSTAEREALLNALRSTQWNRKRAAEILNIEYKALLYKMKKLGIGREQYLRAKPVVAPVPRAASSAAAG